MVVVFWLFCGYNLVTWGMRGGGVVVRESRHPRYAWEVSWLEGNVRKRRFLRSRAEAEGVRKKVLAELEHAAPADGGISAEERAAVRWARREGVDLAVAVGEFLRGRAMRGRSVSVRVAVGARLEGLERKGVSKEYLGNVRRLLGRAVGAWGERLLCEVGEEEVALLVWSQKMSAVARGDFLGALRALWGEGMKRGWVERNVPALVEAPRVAVKRPGILSPAEAVALLAACAPVLRPAVALGLYAGLRMCEIERLAWDEVLLARGVVEVRAEKSKTGTRRLVRIEPVLERILSAVPPGDRVGRVWPVNGRRLLEGAKGEVGGRRSEVGGRKAEVGGRKSEDGGRKSEVGGWRFPANGLRHSFASYHLAHFRDAGRTALELGHTTTAMLFAHYRELVTPEDAALFWKG